MQLILSLIVSATILFKLFNGVVEVHQCEAVEPPITGSIYYPGMQTPIAPYTSLAGSVTCDHEPHYVCCQPTEYHPYYLIFVVFERAVYMGPTLTPIIKNHGSAQFELNTSLELRDDCCGRVEYERYQFSEKLFAVDDPPIYCFPHSTESYITHSFIAYFTLYDASTRNGTVDYPVIDS